MWDRDRGIRDVGERDQLRQIGLIVEGQYIH